MKQSKQEPVGRITGSASIDTLMRVNEEKYNGKKKEVLKVIHDFTACVAEELTVRKGDIVQMLYRDNDWLYVMTNDREGFVPNKFCTPINRIADNHSNSNHDDSVYSIENMVGRCAERNYSPESNTELDTTFLTTEDLENQHLDTSFLATDKLDTTILDADEIENEDLDTTCEYFDDLDKSFADESIVGERGSAFNIATIRDVDKLSAKLRAKLRVGSAACSEDDGCSSGFYSQDACSDTSPSPQVAPCRVRLTRRVQSGRSPSLSSVSTRSQSIDNLYRPQSTQPLGQYLVLFAFQAGTDADLSVYSGQTVTVLNKDNQHWYWARSAAKEGFVPASHLIPMDGSDSSAESDGYWPLRVAPGEARRRPSTSTLAAA